MIDDENNQIVYRDYIDISVAVATPKVEDFYGVFRHNFVVVYVFYYLTSLLQF